MYKSVTGRLRLLLTDSRKPKRNAGCIGFQNPNRACWMISMLSAILATPTLLEALSEGEQANRGTDFLRQLSSKLDQKKVETSDRFVTSIAGVLYKGMVMDEQPGYFVCVLDGTCKDVYLRKDTLRLTSISLPENLRKQIKEYDTDHNLDVFNPRSNIIIAGINGTRR